MTETEYLEFCKSQITGPLKEEDIITMLTAWGAINYSLCPISSSPQIAMASRTGCNFAPALVNE